MAFESLSETYEFLIPDFPPEWLPLIYLYDPDLPLYPLLYFHRLDPALPNQMRPGERDRVFGFVHHINLEQTQLRVCVALNKDLANPANDRYRAIVEDEIKSRLGFAERITLDDVTSALTGELSEANSVLVELWYQIVNRSFGKSLPFGKIWDPVLGLVRFIASWNSDGGRKGELIQTHYFAASFGERIATGGDIHVDFYLLPTFEEFIDQTNPLNLFPNFSNLLDGAADFCGKYCKPRIIGTQSFSAFDLKSTKAGSKLNTKMIIVLIEREAGRIRDALFENYNAFNRGPHRSIIALMMFNDLRCGKWTPSAFTPAVCASLYKDLARSYQTPKVIQLYAQQCFGAPSALPIDIWIKTFLSWPLGFEAQKKKWYEKVFDCSNVWGKIERLIWLAAQSRKVHSSVSAEILWCIRYGDPNGHMRGANPMSCKICADHIRDKCPAYRAIMNEYVSFNSLGAGSRFNVETSAKNNHAPNQRFVRCVGDGGKIVDEYSSRDRAHRFQPFPLVTHNGDPLRVQDFIDIY